MKKNNKNFRKFLTVICSISTVLSLASWSFGMLSTNTQYDENEFRATHPEYVEYLETTEPYPWLHSEQAKYKYYFLTEEEQAKDETLTLVMCGSFMFFGLTAVFSGAYVAKLKKEEEKDLEAALESEE